MGTNPWEQNNEAQRQWFAKWAHEQEVCRTCESKLGRKCFEIDRMDATICQNLQERVSMERSREKNGPYNEKQVPPGFTIISRKPGEVSEEAKRQIFNVLDSTIDTFLASKIKQRAERGI